MREFVDRARADKLMVVSHIYDYTARLRSHEITAAVKAESSVLGAEDPQSSSAVP